MPIPSVETGIDIKRFTVKDEAAADGVRRVVEIVVIADLHRIDLNDLAELKQDGARMRLVPHNLTLDEAPKPEVKPIAGGRQAVMDGLRASVLLRRMSDAALAKAVAGDTADHDAILKALKQATGLPIARVRDEIRSLPATIVADVPQPVAAGIVTALRALGCEVELQLREAGDPRVAEAVGA